MHLLYSQNYTDHVKYFPGTNIFLISYLRNSSHFFVEQNVICGILGIIHISKQNKEQFYKKKKKYQTWEGFFKKLEGDYDKTASFFIIIKTEIETGLRKVTRETVALYQHASFITVYLLEQEWPHYFTRLYPLVTIYHYEPT